MRSGPRFALLLACCGCLVAALLVTPHGSANGAPTEPVFPKDSTMAKIQVRGELIVGVKFDVPTFGQKNPITGKVEGFEPDLARILGNELFGASGHVKFIEAPGPEREAMVEQGKADLVSSTYSITPAREKAVAFAGPIYFSRPAVMVRQDYKGMGDSIPGYQALNKYSVCTVTGSIEADLIEKKAPHAKLMLLPGNSECVAALKQGRVETYASDDVVVYGFLKKDPHQFRFVANPNGLVTPYGIGIKKSATDLCTWVNKELLAAFKDGAWAKVFEATIGQVVHVTPVPPTAAEMHYC